MAVWIFLLTYPLSIPFFVGLHVLDDFNAKWLKRRVFATIGAFWGRSFLRAGVQPTLDPQS